MHKVLMASVLVVFIFNGAAQAQWVLRFERPLVSNVDERDLELLIELYEPDADVELILRQILEDHDRAFKAFAAEATPKYRRRSSISTAESERDERYASIVSEEAMQPIAKRQRELDRQALESWRALLHDQDEALWAEFVRRRHLRLFRGMSHQYADLTEVVSELNLELDDSQREQLDDLLDDYQRRRARAISDFMDQVTAFMMERPARSRARILAQDKAEQINNEVAESGGDPAEAYTAASAFLRESQVNRSVQTWRAYEPRRRIRRINLEFTEIISASLMEANPAAGEAFLTAAQETLYAEAFEEHPAERYLESLFAATDDQDTLTMLQAERDTYRQRDAMLQQEVIRATNALFRARDRRPGGSLPTGVGQAQREQEAAINARATWSDRTVERVFLLLSDELKAAVPRPGPARRAGELQRHADRAE